MSYPIHYVPAGDVLPIFFDTYDGGTGASITMSGLAVTDIEIYKDGSITQRASDAGYTLLDTDGIDFDSITGIHGFSIDTGDNTDAGFYTVGAWFHVVVSAVTVDAQTVNFIAAAFRLMPAEGIAGKPKVDVDGFGGSAGTFASGRPEVNTTHAAGTAWGSGAITAASIAADAITAAKIADGAIDAATFATGAIDAAAIATGAIDADAIADNAIDAGAIASDAITAAKIATGAITAAKFAAGAIDAAAVATGAIDADALAADAVTEIRALASGTADSGTTTTMVDAARTEADTDYWKDLAIVFTSGTIAGQARLITAFTPGTDTITFSPATTQAVGTNTYEIHANVAAAGASAPTAAEVADAVWDEDATAHQTQGTFGQAIGDPAADTNTIYKAVVTDAAGATVGVDVVAVKADTAAILTDTAVIGATGEGLTSLATQASVNTIDDFLDTEIAAIKTKTDFLPSATAGSAGGVMIAGSNAATTFATLTVSGATIYTGNVSLAAGLTITQSTGNGHGIVCTGNGTGSGFVANGGATGMGGQFNGGVTAGTGLQIDGVSGVGLEIAGGTVGHGVWVRTISGTGIIIEGTEGYGIAITSSSTNAAHDAVGITCFGDGDGLDVRALGTGVDIRGDITGNLTGSVSGSVGSVTGLTAANLDTTVSSRATPAQVNAEVLDVLNVDTFAQPGQETPAATNTIRAMLAYLFKAWRNRTTQTASEYALYNDNATTVDHKATFTDDATTADRGEVTTGP